MENHLLWNLFFNKVGGCKFAKKENVANKSLFSSEFWEIFKNAYFEEHLQLATCVLQKYGWKTCNST